MREKIRALVVRLRGLATRADSLDRNGSNESATIASQRHKIKNKNLIIKRLREQLAQRNGASANPSAGATKSAPTYRADAMTLWGKDTSFIREPRFAKSYDLGMKSGHKLGRERGVVEDLNIEWRVHVICWAAWHAAKLPGDFVECGVNTGIYSLAVAHYIDFNRTGKAFYLFDTFEGIPEEQISSEERALGRHKGHETAYEECYDLAKSNFSPYPMAHLVRGKVPDTLDSVSIERVCYLSIDMNIAAPEVAALRYFWDKLVPGAVVVFDDYGWVSQAPQKEAIDVFVREVGCEVLNLPTGQGLLLKPPA